MPKTNLRQRFSFTSTQKKVLFTLASMVGLRMLGLFLVLPVFTLYGLRFTNSKFLVGFAFGAYALTMAILQIPLGRLSDRIGRRKVLIMGMTFFSVGSVLCALPQYFPHSWQIWELIFGRLVQGGGAIISVAFATVADYVEPERRSTAMADPGYSYRNIVRSWHHRRAHSGRLVWHGIALLDHRNPGAGDGLPAGEISEGRRSET